MRRKPTAPQGFRNRIVGHGEEAPDQLLANPKNFRIHPQSQQDALAGVLDKVGWVQQVVVNQRTGFVVDGHLRVALAITRDEPSVPVTYVDLSEEEEALILATFDPLGAMAGTDKDLLADLLQGLGGEDGAIRDLLDGLAREHGLELGESTPDPGAEMDRAEELREKWGVERGSVWAAGDHRVMCGDATDEGDVARLMGGAGADLFLGDPPYGISYQHGARKGGRRLGQDGQTTFGDDKAFDPSAILESFSKVMLWGANHFADQLPASPGWLVWDKRDGAASDDQSDCELAWTNCLTTARLFHCMWRGGVRTGPEQMEGRIHINQKPAELMAWCLNFVPDAIIVADFFLGSGTTLVACEQLGRRGFGMEIEPKYAAVSIERLAGMGLKPRRERKSLSRRA